MKKLLSCLILATTLLGASTKEAVNLSADLNLPAPLQGEDFYKNYADYYENFRSLSKEFEQYDFTKGLDLDYKYCDLGFSEACLNLSLSLAVGNGVKPNKNLALKLIEYAKNGYPDELKAHKKVADFFYSLIKDLKGEPKEYFVNEFKRLYAIKNISYKEFDRLEFILSLLPSKDLGYQTRDELYDAISSKIEQEFTQEQREEYYKQSLSSSWVEEHFLIMTGGDNPIE